MSASAAIVAAMTNLLERPFPLLNRSLGVLAAGALVALPAPASAASDGPVQFVVTSAMQTASNASARREVLNLAPSGGLLIVQIADAGGLLGVIQAKRNSNGVIQAETTDQGVTCYNMAANLIAQAGTHTVAPVLVAAGDTVVPVALDVHTKSGRDATNMLDADGTAFHDLPPTNGTNDRVAIAVHADVQTQHGTLVAATFAETTYLNDPSQVIATTSCSLERVMPNPLASATAAAI
jgi:hypothetical protein